MTRHLISAPLSLLVVMVLYLIMHGLLNQQQTIYFKENNSEFVFSPIAVKEKVRAIYCGRGLYRKPLTKAELWKATYKAMPPQVCGGLGDPFGVSQSTTTNTQQISQGIIDKLILKNLFNDFVERQNKPVTMPYNQKLTLSWLPQTNYPTGAERIEGWVELEIQVNSQGTVDDIHVIAANPPRVFDRTAIRAYKKAKYLPEIINGKAVAKTIIQRIDFKLAED